MSKKLYKFAMPEEMVIFFLQSTKPLQEYLEVPLDEERDQLELAKFLPHALFVVFNETRAYAKVFGNWFLLHNFVILYLW